MYGDGYQEFADYSVVDAVPNLGYKNSAGLPLKGKHGGFQTQILILSCKGWQT